jgi:hypothetical protein
MADYELPDGYENEADFINDALELFQMDVDADRLNRLAAEDDLKFACNFGASPGSSNLGHQWDPAVAVSREGRPCLVNNVLPQYIAQIIGDNRINRPAIKVRPAEDADEDLAEIRAGLIRAIEYQSNAQEVYAHSLQGSATCGIGNFRCGLDYADNETFLRDLRIKKIGDHLSVVWDHASIELTGRDAERCFISDTMRRKLFEKRWPSVIPSDLGTLATNVTANGWVTEDEVRVTEYWRMESEKRTLAQMTDGKILDITDDDEETRKKAAPQIVETREVTRRKACMWLITGNAILEGPFEVPVDRIPIFRCYGQVYWAGNQRVWFGLVRFMKDPQRLQNYADSIIAESLATAPKQQWLADSIAVEGREETIRQAHRSGDPLLIKNQGGEMQRIDPPPMPIGILQWRQLLTQQLKDLSGLHDASLGISSNETSGKAIMARQREGDVATIVYHDNLNAAIGECGRVLNQLIPVVYDTARTIRIVGADETAKVQRVNDPNDEKSADLTKGKYDIVVETGPSYSTKRVEAAESMIAFVQAFPQAAAVTGDLIATAQDWPDAEKFADRLKAILPPELQEQKDPEDMTPEEQQEAAQSQAQQQQQAQQAQQLQEISAMTALETAKAELLETQARTRKLEAEAAKIGAEAEQPEQPAQQPSPVIDLAEVRRAVADAEKAEADADTARARAREAEANAAIAEARARMAATDTAFNDIDTEHKLAHGRGITDPDPAAQGAGEAA